MAVENHWTVQKWGQKFVFFLSLWIFGTFQFFQSLPLRWSKLSIAIFGPLSYLINWFFISLHQLWIPFVAKISCRLSQLIIKFAIWTPFTVHAVYCKDWTRLSQGQRFISWLEQFGQTKYSTKLRYRSTSTIYHPLWQTIVDSHLKRSSMNRKVRLEKKERISSCRLGHSGFKSIKPAESKFTQSDFTSFYKQIFANLHYFRFRSLWNIQKSVKSLQAQYDPSISQNFQSNFGGFLLFGPTV